MISTTAADSGFACTKALGHLPIIQRHTLQTWGCGPARALPYACIHQAFEAHAAATPHGIAALCSGQSISYEQLNRQADRLARHLLAQGVMAGDTVALFVERSIPMLVGMLAVLKIGAAYVPQDARITPPAQLAMILEALSSAVVLTLSGFKDQLPLAAGHLCVCLDEFLAQQPWVAQACELNVAAPDPASLCFVLFTSGTTGRPNGVRVTHRNVCNILLTAPGNLGIKPGMRVGQILNIAFDMAAWEILGCLAHGATLYIRQQDIGETARHCQVLIATPSILATLDPRQCATLEVVAVAGEPCPQALADRWAAHCTFYNGCGPTETTIVNTLHRHVPGAPLTIGQPTPNNTVYVLDEHGQACTPGEVGEMWAGGDGVTAGYLHDPLLTAQRYRPDPFLGAGRMMFRTRDLGRWTHDGALEHLGRVDDQVKVRGFRVELDALASTLEASGSCSRAVALKFDSQHLVAFVTPATADIAAARQFCAQRLAYYCVPAVIFALEHLPLTARGKIDKTLLRQWACDSEEGRQLALKAGGRA
ncbi:amino acid adenylation domain-containing protein [Pseudomonas sp. WMBT8]|uniref:amino acid adenylation domain-containing protein n=1 Tax=Pseudomonas sp. WMBT8 TaxID=3414496 RepID=UPI003D802113